MSSGGLASSDPTEVRNVAQNALLEFDSLPPEQQHLQHAMTRRFCQPDWKGLNDKAKEIPLRPFLERLAKGQSQHSAVVMLHSHRTDKLALGLDLDLDRLSSIDE